METKATGNTKLTSSNFWFIGFMVGLNGGETTQSQQTKQ
jgi:hypothetical protein